MTDSELERLHADYRKAKEAMDNAEKLMDKARSKYDLASATYSAAYKDYSKKREALLDHKANKETP